MEDAGGHPRRRVDIGVAAGGWVETAAECRGRMCQNASICFRAVENCWATSSTASPNCRPERLGSLRSIACESPSYLPRSAIGGSWTTGLEMI